jgi:hypothetical protein
MIASPMELPNKTWHRELAVCHDAPGVTGSS